MYNIFSTSDCFLKIKNQTLETDTDCAYLHESRMNVNGLSNFVAMFDFCRTRTQFRSIDIPIARTKLRFYEESEPSNIYLISGNYHKYLPLDKIRTMYPLDKKHLSIFLSPPIATNEYTPC